MLASPFAASPSSTSFRVVLVDSGVLVRSAVANHLGVIIASRSRFVWVVQVGVVSFDVDFSTSVTGLSPSCLCTLFLLVIEDVGGCFACFCNFDYVLPFGFVGLYLIGVCFGLPYPNHLLFDMGLCGLERVVNACCDFCRKLIVRDPISY